MVVSHPHAATWGGPRLARRGSRALVDGTGRSPLRLHGQDGKAFHEHDGDRVVRTNLTEGRNHGYSERMQLARLYGHVIDVFHADPATGTVDVAARLVPAMVIDDARGQETFRLVVKNAPAADDVAPVTLDGSARQDLRLPNPKDLRSPVVTDLQWVPRRNPAALRRYAGHAPGTDVYSLHCATDQLVNEKVVVVRLASEDGIA